VLCEEKGNRILEVFLSLSSCHYNSQPDSHHTLVFIPIFWFVGHLADPYTTQSLYQIDGGDGDYEPPGSAGVA